MYLPHFSELLLYYLGVINEMPKILHLSGTDTVSWCTFMMDWCVENNIDRRFVIPRDNEVENGFAPRGHKLGLNVSLSKKLGFPQYSYLDGLRRMNLDNSK